MADNHLGVPGAGHSSATSNSTRQQRSNSTRSQRSQRSQHANPSQPQPQPQPRPPQTPNYDGRPSIRIRRFSSSQVQPSLTAAQSPPHDSGRPVTPGTSQHEASNITIDSGGGGTGVRRQRSVSEPYRHDVAGCPPVTTPGLVGGTSYMPDLAEETTTSPTAGHSHNGTEPFPDAPWNVDRPTRTSPPQTAPPAQGKPSPASNSGWRPLRRAKTNIAENADNHIAQKDFAAGQSEYESELVDLLDLVDPEVSTLSTLTNVQNSLFIPDLGKYLNRRPTYNLTRRPSELKEEAAAKARRPSYITHRPSDIEEVDTGSLSPSEDGNETPGGTARPSAQRTPTSATLNTISSKVNEKYYAVLPHGVNLRDWTEEEKLELNDHVRHMLHSKRSKFKRSMKGFGQYVKRPLGFFVTLYATLITLFGLAWVLFLIGWVNVGGRQSYIINVIDNVLVALFAIMGDGLAPFRAVDTYHMIFIAHYHHFTWDQRKKKKLPELQDHNDLPLENPEDVATKDDDVERQEYSVLSEKQLAKLKHHQGKFSKSHSFYKPHETATHHAFPLRLLVAIVVLLDCHSFLQIALGTCTWSIPYKTRPFALTTVILCCSITCNITAGVLITVGDHKTRKKDVKERMFRQELTQEAIKKVEKRKERESMDLERAMESGSDSRLALGNSHMSDGSHGSGNHTRRVIEHIGIKDRIDEQREKERIDEQREKEKRRRSKELERGEREPGGLPEMRTRKLGLPGLLEDIDDLSTTIPASQVDSEK